MVRPATHPRQGVQSKDIERSWLMSENLRFGLSWGKTLSIFLLKQFYGTFNSVCGWTNRFWQRWMLMRCVTLLKMQERLSEAAFTDSHLWSHAAMRCPSWCATRWSRFALFPEKMKIDSCFIACMCQDICLSTAEPPGEPPHTPPHPTPTSASTSPAAVLIVSLCTN